MVFLGSAATWAVVVWVWPGLHPGNGLTSRGLQPSVLIAAASIQAAVVLFGLAVGAIVLQVMSNYSWAVVRTVLPPWFIPALALVVSAGVIFPLWVSFGPSDRLSVAAFAGFGWSLLVVGATVWETAQRMNPSSLSEITRRRALNDLSRDQPSRKALDDLTQVLGQLAGEAQLPFDEGLRMMASYVMVLADRSRQRSDGDIATAVQALAERVTSIDSAALASGIVKALWVLGLDQADRPPVVDAVHQALIAVAREARRAGQRELARAALDALAGITAKCVACALPRVGYQTPRKPQAAELPPERSEAGFFPPATFPSSLLAINDEAQVTQLPSKAARRISLNRFVQDFAADDDAPAEVLADILTGGLVRAAEAARNDTPGQHERSRWWDDYDQLDATVGTFISLLPAPQPASTRWPTGWQGHGIFDEDIRRLAGLVECLYRQGKHVPTDLVEDALETIGVRLRAEQPLATDLPAARTGWRYPPMRSEEGGLAATTADSLRTLMSAAFDAGFDRRALSTGLRILASATASAKQGDRDATVAYANALIRFTLDTSLHGFEAQSDAGSLRVQAVLIGVIAEFDQLLAAAREQKGHDREIYEKVEELALALAWNTPRPRMFATVIAMLQTRLAAVGWAVALPTGQRRIDWFQDPVAPAPPLPLHGELLTETQELFAHWMGHAEVRLPAALIALWTHAACALRQGSAEEARRIAAFLADQLRLQDERYAEMPAALAMPGEEQAPGYQELDAQLRRLISAAVRWCRQSAPTITPMIPRAAGARTVRSVARSLLHQPDTRNWTYRGDENAAETHLVTVEMRDRSRRVLRDRDLRTGDLRWGYTGSGAHDLASVLVADSLDCRRYCPDCFGVIPLAAGIIRCRSCSNSGKRPGTIRAQQNLLTKVIDGLPDSFEVTRLDLLLAMMSG